MSERVSKPGRVAVISAGSVALLFPETPSVSNGSQELSLGQAKLLISGMNI
jgi:hypothetical protein